MSLLIRQNTTTCVGCIYIYMYIYTYDAHCSAAVMKICSFMWS